MRRTFLFAALAAFLGGCSAEVQEAEPEHNYGWMPPQEDPEAIRDGFYAEPSLEQVAPELFEDAPKQ